MQPHLEPTGCLQRFHFLLLLLVKVAVKWIQRATDVFEFEIRQPARVYPWSSDFNNVTRDLSEVAAEVYSRLQNDVIKGEWI